MVGRVGRGGSCLGDRPGHDLDACHPVRFRRARRSRSPSVSLSSIIRHRGMVEHDPEQIWRDTARGCARGAGARLELDASPRIGITNQRETVVVWDRATGEPIHRAIVWQDRRTADECAQLKAEGAEEMVRERTGLLLDPYFSAPRSPGSSTTCRAPARAPNAANSRAGRSTASFCGASQAARFTRPTSQMPARTSLFDIHRQCWDERTLPPVPGARRRCFPKSTTTVISSGRRRRVCSTCSCRLAAWRETSRPRCSGRPASRLAWRSRPTAPAASCS